MKLMLPLLLAAAIIGFFIADWHLNDGTILIFVGRKLIALNETLAIWR
ncbi:MAG: hypothetical protein AAF919_04965 [Pseudomonadota bacterium]